MPCLFQIPLYQGLWLGLRWMYLYGSQHFGLHLEFDTPAFYSKVGRGTISQLPLSNPGLVLKGKKKLNCPCPQFSKKSDWDEGGEDGPQTRRQHVRRNSFERLWKDFNFSHLSTRHRAHGATKRTAHPSVMIGARRGDLLLAERL